MERQTAPDAPNVVGSATAVVAPAAASPTASHGGSGCGDDDDAAMREFLSEIEGLEASAAAAAAAPLVSEEAAGPPLSAAAAADCVLGEELSRHGVPAGVTAAISGADPPPVADALARVARLAYLRGALHAAQSAASALFDTLAALENDGAWLCVQGGSAGTSSSAVVADEEPKFVPLHLLIAGDGGEGVPPPTSRAIRACSGLGSVWTRSVLLPAALPIAPPPPPPPPPPPHSVHGSQLGAGDQMAGSTDTAITATDAGEGVAPRPPRGCLLVGYDSDSESESDGVDAALESCAAAVAAAPPPTLPEVIALGEDSGASAAAARGPPPIRQLAMLTFSTRAAAYAALQRLAGHMLNEEEGGDAASPIDGEGTDPPHVGVDSAVEPATAPVVTGEGGAAAAAEARLAAAAASTAWLPLRVVGVVGAGNQHHPYPHHGGAALESVGFLRFASAEEARNAVRE